MNILAKIKEVVWPKTTLNLTKEIKPKKAKKSTKKKPMKEGKKKKSLMMKNKS